MFSDIHLARRLERAEGYAAAMFAGARARLYPESGATWLECGGAFVVFDGPSSPITQTFGLGIFEELTPDTLDTIEQFFFQRNAPVFHEVCPLAGVAALELLCRRGYTPVEISSVLYRDVELPASRDPEGVTARPVGPDELQEWADVSARAWAHELPELEGFLRETGALFAAREHSVCFLAEAGGQSGAAGALCIHDGVAVFAGAATVPELRRRGLQAALLRHRMRYAAEHGCDLAMMVAEAGSNSQRNAERQGFRIAYTRTKSCLRSPAERSA